MKERERERERERESKLEWDIESKYCFHGKWVCMRDLIIPVYLAFYNPICKNLLNQVKFIFSLVHSDANDVTLQTSQSQEWRRPKSATANKILSPAMTYPHLPLGPTHPLRTLGPLSLARVSFGQQLLSSKSKFELTEGGGGALGGKPRGTIPLKLLLRTLGKQTRLWLACFSMLRLWITIPYSCI